MAVAAFARWHEHHDAAWQALENSTVFLAPCLVETFSVLTRLPPPHRVAPEIAAEFLDHVAARGLVALPVARYRTLLHAGVTGGAVYDGLVAATARHAGVTLVTLDRRAIPTYERLGVRFEALAG